MTKSLARAQVTPISKDSQSRRQWNCKVGNEGCTYAKPCRSCLGRRNRRKGQVGQREFQRRAGIAVAAHRSVNSAEEAWGDWFRWEHKAGAQVRPAITAYRRVRKQSEANRPIGDTRPFAGGLSYDGTLIACIDADTWRLVVVPALAAYWGDPS